MASSEYFGREAVAEFIRSYRCSTDVAFHMEQHLNEIPAADVRPVVTCGECKYWGPSTIEPPFHVCTYVCGATFVREAEDFCSRGEKREES